MTFRANLMSYTPLHLSFSGGYLLKGGDSRIFSYIQLDDVNIDGSMVSWIVLPGISYRG